MGRLCGHFLQQFLQQCSKCRWILSLGAAEKQTVIEVRVMNDQVDRAMRDLKRKLIKEGLFKELSRRKFNIKPSLARRLKSAQAEKVRKKEARRERERIGFDL